MYRYGSFDPLPAASAGWPSKIPPNLATARAYATLQAQARRTVAREVKAGARRFALAPTLLDNIEIGLSRLTPRGLNCRLKELFAEELTVPRSGWIGGLIPALNLKSARVYARHSTFVERSRRRR